MLDSDHCGPEPPENLLQQHARGDTLRPDPLGRRQTELLRQITALQFARRTLRKLVDNHDALWDLKRCQVRRGKLANVMVSSYSMRVQHDRRCHFLAQPRMGHGKGYSLGYGGMIQKHVVHFLRCNFFSTTIDELLRTAGDKQIAIRIEVPLVAGPEPSMHKGMSRGRGIIVVA